MLGSLRLEQFIYLFIHFSCGRGRDGRARGDDIKVVHDSFLAGLLLDMSHLTARGTRALEDRMRARFLYIMFIKMGQRRK